MAPKLYMIDVSPPVRAVLLTAEALGVKLEHIEVDMLKQEHLASTYLKLNPQHTVPTLNDDGKVIWDSHAIITYLVEKFGKDDSLYPKDPYQRAIINQRLHFDSGMVFPALMQISKPIMMGTEKGVSPEKAAALTEIYEFLEKFLEGHEWVAGDNLTLADLSLIPSITTVSIAVPIDQNRFPNISAWIERAQNLPYYDANQIGLEKIKAFFLSKLNA